MREVVVPPGGILFMLGEGVHHWLDKGDASLEVRRLDLRERRRLGWLRRERRRCSRGYA